MVIACKFFYVGFSFVGNFSFDLRVCFDAILLGMSMYERALYIKIDITLKSNLKGLQMMLVWLLIAIIYK